MMNNKSGSLLLFTVIIIVLAILLFCYNYQKVPIKRNDIYAKCLKGNKISYELFRKAEKIIKSDDKYFIWLDLYNNGDDQYAVHLLVCDSDLTLKGACYVSTPSPALVTSVKNDTIYGWTVEDTIREKKVKSSYRNDLPPDIKFHLIRKQKWNGFQRRSNTIIDSIAFLPNQFLVKIYARVSTNNLYAWQGKEKYLNNISHYSKLFDSCLVIELPVSRLCFPRSGEYLYTYEEPDILNEMHVLNKNIIDALYFDIWGNIQGATK